MRILSSLLVGLVGSTALLGCAEGVDPPATTELVKIQSGLVYRFGPDETCFQPSEKAVCIDQSTNAGFSAAYQAARNSSDAPQVTVRLAPFAIDAHEVTNLQYRYCVEAEVCSKPFNNAVDESQQTYYSDEKYEDHPVVNMTWAQANTYCEFVGKRLPTELEWERAAKGPKGTRQYPADIASLSECTTKGMAAKLCGKTDQTLEAINTASQSFATEPAGKIFNLFGNAAEWTADLWAPDVTCKSDAPCAACWACDNPGVDQAICQQRCKDCTDCGNPNGGPVTDAARPECHFACTGQAFQSVRCLPYGPTEVIDYTASQSLATPTADADFHRVIKGGDVRSGADACHFRSSYRARQPQDIEAQHIGFRCAVTLTGSDVKCTGDCTGKACGDDGCGTSCGTCPNSGDVCNAAGQCECKPNCIGRACGADTCGNADVCGTCAAGLSCDGTSFTCRQ